MKIFVDTNIFLDLILKREKFHDALLIFNAIEKKLFEVKLEDDLDQLIASMGMKGQRIQNVSEIKSPMPGLVLKLLNQSGEEVTAGETILVLEAMKMENAIKSPIEGVIQSIEVKEGQSLDKGMVLIRF